MAWDGWESILERPVFADLGREVRFRSGPRAAGAARGRAVDPRRAAGARPRGERSADAQGSRGADAGPARTLHGRRAEHAKSHAAGWRRRGAVADYPLWKQNLVPSGYLTNIKKIYPNLLNLKNYYAPNMVSPLWLLWERQAQRNLWCLVGVIILIPNSGILGADLARQGKFWIPDVVRPQTGVWVGTVGLRVSQTKRRSLWRSATLSFGISFLGKFPLHLAGPATLISTPRTFGNRTRAELKTEGFQAGSAAHLRVLGVATTLPAREEPVGSLPQPGIIATAFAVHLSLQLYWDRTLHPPGGVWETANRSESNWRPSSQPSHAKLSGIQSRYELNRTSRPSFVFLQTFFCSRVRGVAHGTPPPGL